MANTQYINYKNDFKNQCILNTVSGLLALIAVIVLLFADNFVIADEVFTLKFSLYDEIKFAFEAFKSDSGFSMVLTFAYLQVIAIIMFGFAAIAFIYELIKSVIGILNMDNYALDQYDKIKKRAFERKKNKQYSSGNMFIGAIIYEFFYIFYTKAFSGYLGIGEGSYVTHMTGVSGIIAIPIILALCAIAASILRALSFRKVRTAILREDYGVNN